MSTDRNESPSKLNGKTKKQHLDKGKKASELATNLTDSDESKRIRSSKGKGSATKASHKHVSLSGVPKLEDNPATVDSDPTVSEINPLAAEGLHSVEDREIELQEVHEVKEPEFNFKSSEFDDVNPLTEIQEEDVKEYHFEHSSKLNSAKESAEDGQKFTKVVRRKKKTTSSTTGSSSKSSSGKKTSSSSGSVKQSGDRNGPQVSSTDSMKKMQGKPKASSSIKSAQSVKKVDTAADTKKATNAPDGLKKSNSKPELQRKGNKSSKHVVSRAVSDGHPIAAANSHDDWTTVSRRAKSTTDSVDSKEHRSLGEKKSKKRLEVSGKNLENADAIVEIKESKSGDVKDDTILKKGISKSQVKASKFAAPNLVEIPTIKAQGAGGSKSDLKKKNKSAQAGYKAYQENVDNFWEYLDRTLFRLQIPQKQQ